MNLNLLLINNNIDESKRVSSLLGTYFKNISTFSILNNGNTLKEAESVQPDIVIFDIDPNNNTSNVGYGIINKLKDSLLVPLLVTSSSEDYEKAYNAGATFFMQKPFTDITFISALKSTISFINIMQSVRVKEQEIEAKNHEIQTQIENENLQQQYIAKKNKEIMADIRYASRIQQATLPNIEFINDNLDEYFILHQPKSYVSGDFYWVSIIGNKQYIAVGDCTGHGLSGALMHMLGSVYLNEIVSSENYNTASEILDQLRNNIMKSLNQKGESGEAQDGMDIALCIIDTETKTLQFAGANNPIYIINNNELNEIKGDRMPVGIHINFNKPFTNHTINLESNDQIYLFSDGYADQFGGPRGKKFRYKQFKELLVNISHEPMNIQKEILNNTHDKWRGSVEQIDDILVFGIKIK